MKRANPLKALRANWWIALILTALALMCLLPILHTVAISFSDQARAAAGDVGFWPVGFSLNSYAKLLQEGTFLTAFAISLERVFLAIAISVSITILCAYALSKSPRVFRGRNVYLWNWRISSRVIR